jgi:hypothetical protein
MKTQRAGDIASGLFLAATGAVMGLESFSIGNILQEPLHPRTLPLGMSVFTIAAGLLLSIRSYRSADNTQMAEWPDREGWICNGIFFAALVAFLLLIPFLGLPLASAMFVTGLVWYLERSLVRPLVTGICVFLSLYFGFVRFLDLPLPMGILEGLG